jgi:hypothetical protein
VLTMPTGFDKSQSPVPRRARKLSSLGVERGSCGAKGRAPKEGVTKLLALPREELAIEIIERVFAPKGYTTQPGFQPISVKIMRGASMGEWF